MTENTTIRLKIARHSAHPWLFQKMVVKPSPKPPNGSVVEIEDRDGNWVGRGFYNGHSRIAVRVLTTDPNEQIDEAFFQQRIDRALQLRRDILRLDEVTDSYRLVHSEGDDLSGLVVDRFADSLAVEFFSSGMYRRRDVIVQCLHNRVKGQAYWFAEEHIQKQESFDCRSPEPPPPVTISEHGLRFRVALGSKHKTGFFLDQRDNRKLLTQFCRGKTVLDLCTNSGGFAVYAKALGAAGDVVAVDLDESALELAQHNAKLNKASIRFVQADLFSWLRDIQPSGRVFDVVVLDPSKQTRDREALPRALKRYLDMNRLAMQAVAPDGLLLTCSCTGLVKEADFLETLRRAAWQAGKTLQVLAVTGAAADHPFLVHVQESRYLKVVLCRVF